MKYAKERETLKARYANLTLSNRLMQACMLDNASSCLKHETQLGKKVDGQSERMSQLTS